MGIGEWSRSFRLSDRCEEVAFAGKGLERGRICGEEEFPSGVAEALGRLRGDVEQWGEPRTWTLLLGNDQVKIQTAG